MKGKFIMSKIDRVILCGALALVVLAAPVMADDAAAGRDVLAKYQGAVLKVKLVIQMTQRAPGGQEQKAENKGETIGTVIDPSGLTLVSLAATDPGALVARAMKARGVELKSEVSDVKIVLLDGTELPAKVVLRDNDLDMAFIRPIDKPDKPLVAVDLAKDAKPAILENLVVVGRLGEIGGRVPVVSLSEVRAIIEKPRTLYVLRQDGSEVGSPVFTLDGKVAGVILLRSTDGSGASQQGLMTVVLPSADIAEAAKQAPEVEKKNAEPKPEPAK